MERIYSRWGIACRHIYSKIYMLSNTIACLRCTRNGVPLFKMFVGEVEVLLPVVLGEVVASGADVVADGAFLGGGV
jgi:hypothetical protein